jgi:hypothetical protein
MLGATCHCGAVRIEVIHEPRTLTNCNCSICRRYGALWAYYGSSEVRVDSAPGATDEYAWGDKTLRFIRCSACGCLTHWEPTGPGENGRMGVNARNFDPAALGPLRIRLLDGACTWKYLDENQSPPRRAAAVRSRKEKKN